MLWRFLDDFQQRVKRGNRKHVYLVNNIHTHSNLRWRINGIVPQIPDVVHAIIGGGINFQHIHTGAGINGFTRFTAIAGIAVIRMKAVDSLGQNFRAAGFACAAGPGKEIGVAHFAGYELGLQRLSHRHLSRDIIKGLRTVFTI